MYDYHDHHITRLDGLPEGRHYEIAEEGHMVKRYASVNTIISHFEPKAGLIRWQKSVGAEQAEVIRQESATRGNNIHATIQASFSRDKEKLSSLANDVEKKMYWTLEPIVKSIAPIIIEKSIYWDKVDEATGIQLGFAGSPDAIGYIPAHLFVDKAGVPVLDKEESVILDWKTKKKWRGAKAFTREGECYYPLIKFCLQLAAYTAAVNQRTDLKFGVKRGFIVGVTETSRKPHVQYIPPESLSWHWGKFKEILSAYCYKKSFNWEDFCKEADEAGHLGYPVYLAK